VLLDISDDDDDEGDNYLEAGRGGDGDGAERCPRDDEERFVCGFT